MEARLRIRPVAARRRPAPIRHRRHRRVPPRRSPVVQVSARPPRLHRTPRPHCDPDRADGVDVRSFFGGRVAVEIGLGEALEQALLCPFHYFGITDNTDLWSNGQISAQITVLAPDGDFYSYYWLQVGTDNSRIEYIHFDAFEGEMVRAGEWSTEDASVVGSFDEADLLAGFAKMTRVARELDIRPLELGLEIETWAVLWTGRPSSNWARSGLRTEEL